MKPDKLACGNLLLLDELLNLLDTSELHLTGLSLLSLCPSAMKDNFCKSSFLKLWVAKWDCARF